MPQDPQRPAARDVLRLVLWFGILSGLAELAMLGVIKFGTLALPPRGWIGSYVQWRHGFLWLSPHILWLAPVGSVLLMLLVAPLVALTARFAPRWGSLARLAGSFAFIGFANLLVTYKRLYPAAALLLAAGLAAVVVRLARRNERRFLALVRRTLPGAIGAVVLTAAVMHILPSVRERLRLARLPLAPPSPNILLLLLDTVRAPNMGLYGYHRPTTPNIDALASRGAVFDFALAPAPWTLPSHVTLFTGHLPYEYSANWLTPYEGEYPTLAERLRGLGYVTAGFVANVVYCGYESGIQRGFLHYEDYTLDLSELLLASGIGRSIANDRLVRRVVGFHDVINRKDAREVTEEFLRWFERRPAGRPFFAFLNYFDAHEPYMPPPPYAARFGDPTVRRNERNHHELRFSARLDRKQMSPAEIQGEVDAYDGAIAFIDAQIGRLLSELEADGVLDRTIVIIASDHGEQFGEHGLHVHGNSLYLPSLHVPLVIVYPVSVPEGVRVANPVGLRDVPETIMELIGQRPGAFPGMSLARYWRGEPLSGNEEAVFSELTDIRGTPKLKSVVFDRYHYLWGEQGAEELYDRVGDPAERENLMQRRYLDVIMSMRRRMAPHIRQDRVLWERLPERAPPVRDTSP